MTGAILAAQILPTWQTKWQFLDGSSVLVKLPEIIEIALAAIVLLLLIGEGSLLATSQDPLRAAVRRRHSGRLTRRSLRSAAYARQIAIR